MIDFSDVILQPGGSVAIKFKHFEVQAPRRDVLQALVDMRVLKTDERAMVMRSVWRALKRAVRNVDAQTITQREAMQMGQDCVFWYVNEIVEGRAKLTEEQL